MQRYKHQSQVHNTTNETYSNSMKVSFALTTVMMELLFCDCLVSVTKKKISTT